MNATATRIRKRFLALERRHGKGNVVAPGRGKIIDAGKAGDEWVCQVEREGGSIRAMVWIGCQGFTLVREATNSAETRGHCEFTAKMMAKALHRLTRGR